MHWFFFSLLRRRPQTSRRRRRPPLSLQRSFTKLSLTLSPSLSSFPPPPLQKTKQQLRRYSACLDIFALQPTRPHRELGDLAAFLAAVAPSYPSCRAAQALPRGLAKLLSSAAAPAMDPPLRLALAKALMLLRNRGAVSAEELLPLWVGCLRLKDKSLRRLVCAHVVADVKRSNSKRRDDRLNRAAQAALGASAAADESSAAARASLGLLAELWRRRLWRDARTANAVAGGCSHADERVAVSALKFFLGEDAAEAAAGDESSDDDDDNGGGEDGGKGGGSSSTLPFAGPGKADIYRATQLGTASSKKKKQAKLKRAMASVKRAAKRERSATAEGFAALQLLHDPQVREFFCFLFSWAPSLGAPPPPPPAPTLFFLRNDERKKCCLPNEPGT